jgi:integrase
MAFVERRAKDRWRARYRGPDGRERSKTFRRKIDADRFLATTEADKARGSWIDPALGRISLADWTERYLKTVVHLKPKTRAGYESLLRTHITPAFGRVSLSRVGPVEVREWVASLIARDLSASRVRQAYFLLSAMLQAAVESDYLARNPCSGVRLPRVRTREMRFLSADELKGLAQSVGRYKALVYVLAYGGLRWGEAAALRRGRCDLLRSRIDVVESLAEVNGSLHFGPTKTHQNRTVRLPRSVSELLATHLAANVPSRPDALVFTAPNGGPLHLSNFRRRIWIPALRHAGLPERLRIHDLRHTCAALLIAQGGHPKAVQAHLGHSSIAVTFDRYGHLFPDELDQLAEAMDGVFRESSAAPVRPGRGLAIMAGPSATQETAV